MTGMNQNPGLTERMVVVRVAVWPAAGKELIKREGIDKKTSYERGGDLMLDLILGGLVTAGLLFYLTYCLVKAEEL